MKKLFILSGGPGSEREVSLKSGEFCVETLKAAGVSCEEIIIEKDKQFNYKGNLMSESKGLDLLKKENALVFQVIHGTYGEDGDLVKKLEEREISHIGSTSNVLERTINKHETEKLLKENNILTTESVLVKSVADFSKLDNLSFPVIIKPNKEGSSVGVIKAQNVDELKRFLEKSVYEYEEVLVQKCISGREFTCGVVEIDGELRPLVPSEVVMEDGRLFDYNSKYFVNGLEITPAVVDEETTKRIQTLALNVHQVTGCKDYSRTDMMLDGDNNLIVLEINTVPGMTKVSFIPAELTASGYSVLAFIKGMITKYS